MSTANFDESVGRAVVVTAEELAQQVALVGLDGVSEKPRFHDAFRSALSADPALGADPALHVLSGERVLPLNDWPHGKLGGFDVVVESGDSGYGILAELKWCRGSTTLHT